MFLRRLNRDSPCRNEQWRPDLKALFLPGKRGRLFSVLYTAEGEQKHPLIILLHGFPGNEQNLDLAQMLRRVGFHVLTMHYSGSWGSDGTFAFFNVLEDVQTACLFVMQKKTQQKYRIDPQNIFLVGHSMGAFAALHVASQIEKISGTIAITPYDFGEMVLHAQNNRDKQRELMSLLKEGAAWLSATNANTLYSELYNSPHFFSLHQHAKALSQKPLLLLGGRLDACATLDIHYLPLVEKISKHCNKLLDTKIFDTDHCFSDRRITLGKTIAAWLINKIT